MTNKTKKFIRGLLVSFAAIFCFSLVVFFSTRNPGSAQTAYADSLTVSTVSSESLSFLEGMQKANRNVTQAILPAVVTLDVVETKTVDSSGANSFPWFFFGNPGKNEEGSDPSPKREYKAEGLGSGVIVRKVGKTYYVLTNQHVAGSAKEIMVNLYDGKKVPGKLVGADERKDIALVSFESDSTTIPIARIGNSDTVQPGDIVFAVGSPLGYMSSVTQGIVSAVGRDGGPNNNISDFIQTDAAINQGNSGGPLINIYGEVVGINSWIASSSGGSQGLGFSIPINNVAKSIDDFISGGRVRYGWLGVSLVSGDETILTDLNLSGKKGALALQVFLGSPADKGGIVPGDYVISLNGKMVKSVEQLVRDVGDLVSGQTASFVVLREGKEKTLNVKIEERNEKTVSDSSKLWPGFTPYSLNTDIRNELKLDKKQKGILVVGVQAKSAAAVMGLQTGDVIIKINDKEVENLSDFYRKLSDTSSREIWFDVLREAQTVSTMRYKR